MVNKEYIHMPPIMPENFPSVYGEMPVVVAGKRVLVLAMRSDKSFYTVIPGEIVEDRSRKNKQGLDISVVRPLEKNERRDVEVALKRANWVEPYNFW